MTLTETLPSSGERASYDKDQDKDQDKAQEKALLESGLVTVLYGYGQVPPDRTHFVDNIRFVGGIARNVPAERARALKKLPFGHAFAILDVNADEVDFARASAYSPLAPEKQAALLMASNLDAVAEALGAERLEQLYSKISAYRAAHNRAGGPEINGAGPVPGRERVSPPVKRG